MEEGTPKRALFHTFPRIAMIAMAVAGVAQTTLGACPDFAAAVNYGAGSFPQSVAVGDFNGDGKADLAVTNGSSNVSILLGNGNGTFAGAVSYGAGGNPISVAIGDFNGDGKVDLAVANSNSNNVSILLGNGDGTFAAAVNYAAGSAPYSVAIGDFNRDGKADLAVANYGSNNVSILLGNGNGTFAGAVSYGAGTNPISVAIGDFNGDGKGDLAVANLGSNNVSILLGNGNGTFAAAMNYGAGTNPVSVAIGDFNGDGKGDLAVANNGSSTVSILLGNGNGTFATAVNYAAGSGPFSVAIGDFNGDGKGDLAVANNISNNVSILLNVGHCTTNCGMFDSAVSYTAEFRPYASATGDFNGDGKIDIAAVNFQSNSVSILLGNGDGTFATAVNYATGTQPYAVAVGDFNRDGKLDLAVVAQFNNQIAILLGDGSGAFGAPTNYSTGATPTSVAVGDFNGDGKLDLAVANNDVSSNSVSIFLGNGNGTFGGRVDYVISDYPQFVAVGDFNRDGKSDLAVAKLGGGVAILLNNGDGTFGTNVDYAVGYAPYSVAVGDFNGDGKLDLAVANSDARSSAPVSVLLGNGDGTFAAKIDVAAGTGPLSIVAADFNGDGKLDLAVAHTGSTSGLAVMLGNGNGTFATPVNYSAGSNPRFVTVGDFNGDGHPDFVVANSGIAFTGDLSVFINRYICPPPDLTVTKTHSGHFAQGQTGATYSITVNNAAGAGPTVAAVSVTDTLPADLTATALTGTGWDCVLGTLTCTRSDSLAAGMSYPSVTLTVNVSATAPTSVTNNVSVSGGGELNVGNNSASDPTTVDQLPDLTVSKSHSGDFTEGDSGRTFTITVSNVGLSPTTGTVTVVDQLQVIYGLTPTALAGTGWACDLGTLTCTRSDALGAGMSYPSITLTVNVSRSAEASVMNFVQVSGGGEVNTSNDATSDTVNIIQVPDLTLTKIHGNTFTQGDTDQWYVIQVSNDGGGATTGTITVTDTLPEGLIATSLSGTGWTCDFGSLTCTRSDTLDGRRFAPQITLTVNVSPTAPANVTNTVHVSGGGETNTSNDTASDPTTITQRADLTITEVHSGNFQQGESGKTYTITVNNISAVASNGMVTVIDALPGALSATALTGTGWDCEVQLLRCTRSDSLGGGMSYPAITLTVTVANDAPAMVTNNANVSGGGEVNTANDSASDLTTIIPAADLTISKTHAGNFGQGQMFKTYSINVNNIGLGPTRGTVTVTDVLPAELTAVMIGGGGWNCTPWTLTCTRSDALAPSASYPAITVTVNVSSRSASLINTATVSGGGEVNAANDISNDLTTVYPQAPSCGEFASAVNYGTSAVPLSVAVGDFNGDGKADLAVANFTSSNVSVLLGNGNGTFAPKVDYGAGVGAFSVAVGDFNGDGKADLAVANHTSNDVSILLGNGNGTFAAAVNYAVGSAPVTVAVGDFNGDGKTDLVVTNQGSNNISFLQGNGDGTFAAAVSFPAHSGANGVVIADFNGDGKADLAVTNASSNDVSILLGNGNGSFSAPVNYGVGASANGIASADFNGDGMIDLAVANSSGGVSILLGNGNGTFQAAVNYSAGAVPYSIAIGDFNGDGYADLAVANKDSNNLSILLGNGNGSFGAATNFPVGSSPRSVALGDFNGDGKPDLVVANFNSNNVSILLNACPDLSLTKSHAGNFTQGQTGKTYSVIVNNIGGVPTSGAVNVMDVLPIDLVATGMSGTGWTCTLATLTCTRSDALAPSASYPPITVTVNVNSNASATVTNTATTWGGGEVDYTGDTALDPTTINASGLIAPTNLIATTTSTSQVALMWDRVTTATKYQVYRSFNNAPLSALGGPVTTASFIDSGLAAGITYVYMVEAIGSSNNLSPPSNLDIATTISFTDEPLSPQSTMIKAIHFTEVRAAIDALRAAKGQPAATYTNTIAAGGLIRAIDIKQMRSFLDAARAALNLPAILYTDHLAAGVGIKAVHIEELRVGAKGLIVLSFSAIPSPRRTARISRPAPPACDESCAPPALCND